MELLHALVEIVVVMGADVDEDAPAEDFTQIFGSVPIACDVSRQVEWFPVLDGVVVDLSRDFVPGLQYIR